MKKKSMLLGCLLTISVPSFAAELPDGQEPARQDADLCALKQQEKNDLFLAAVAKGDIKQAQLFLDCGAEIDAISPKVNLFFPPDVLPKISCQLVILNDEYEQDIRALAGSPMGIDIDSGIAELKKIIATGISIRAIDVAVANGHHEMVKFLLDHPARNYPKMGLSRFGSRPAKKKVTAGPAVAIAQGHDVNVLKTLLDHLQAESRNKKNGQFDGNLWLIHAACSNNSAAMQHLLERQDYFRIDIHKPHYELYVYDNKQQSAKLSSPFHIAVLNGNNTLLGQLLEYECNTAQFPELNNQIRNLLAAAHAEYATIDNALQIHNIPQSLVALVAAYKNYGHKRVQLIEQVQQQEPFLQRTMKTIKRVGQPLNNKKQCNDGEIDLTLISRAPRTSLTLTDSRGRTPLMLAYRLFVLPCQEGKDDDEKPVVLGNSEGARECLELLERQRFALASALIKRQTQSKKLY